MGLREKLERLIDEWEHWDSGQDDYDIGYDGGKRNCARELRELLAKEAGDGLGKEEF